MARKPSLREVDALDLLTRDHESMKRLFKDFDRFARRGGDPERKADVVGRICFGLSIHVQIEEEVFYPAVRAAITPRAVTPAAASLGAVKDLIARLDEMEPGDAHFDAVVAALAACAIKHMDDEQAQLFPELRLARVDTVSLGRQLMQRRKALHEDVTRVGLPRSAADVPTWPMACRVVMT